MGRITIFTANDILSKRAKAILDALELPYTEINLQDHDHYQSTLESLALTSSVPQVFFNTRHIGGFKEVVRELRKWNEDKSCTPLERYHKEIEAMVTPHGFPRVNIRDEQRLKIREAQTGDKTREFNFRWQDSSSISLRNLTEKLELCLPIASHYYRGTTYKRAFTSTQLLEALQQNLRVGNPAKPTKFQNPEALAKNLIELKLVVPVGLQNGDSTCTIGDSFNKLTDAGMYQLQCHANPDVANSYFMFTKKTWIQPSSTASSSAPKSAAASKTVSHLFKLLTKLEEDCLNPKGKVDYTRAYLHESFGEIECAASELQTFDIKSIFEDYDVNEGLAFGINVYNIMLAISLIKIGIPTNVADQRHFLDHVRFNLGGTLFSFSQFLLVLLESGKRTSKQETAPPKRRPSSWFGRKTKHSPVDYRIHFAVNQRFNLGCRSSLPFDMYSADKFESQLNMVGRVICDQSQVCKVRKSGTVSLATFFKDNRCDFGKTDSAIVQCIADTASNVRKPCFEKALSKAYPIEFVAMDWTYHAANFAEYNKDLLVGQYKGIQAITSRFRVAPPTRDEKLRLRTLHSFGLLDTAPENRFDKITAQCQKDLEMPIVLVSLIDRSRQWFKSAQWRVDHDEPGETVRDVAFCSHTILQDDIFYVENALDDDRFAENPLVAGPLNIRFYAGIPLSMPTEDGRMTNIGTFCVVDQKPRKLDQAQKERLWRYANRVKKKIIGPVARRSSVDPSMLDASMSSGCTDDLRPHFM